MLRKPVQANRKLSVRLVPAFLDFEIQAICLHKFSIYFRVYLLLSWHRTLLFRFQYFYETRNNSIRLLRNLHTDNYHDVDPPGSRKCYNKKMIKTFKKPSDRFLSIAGSINFRDFGGYINMEGRHVSKGKLFRCGNMSEILPDAFDDFANLNIGALK